MKDRVFLLLIMLCISVTSCWYDPWKVERYVNLETENLTFHDGFPDRIKYQSYYIGECFVLVELTRNNAKSESGQGPYIVSIEVWAMNEDDGHVILDNAEIISSIEKKHTLFGKGNLPKEFSFEKIPKSSYYRTGEVSRARLVADEKLCLDFEENEIVTIIVDLKVITQVDQIHEGKIKSTFTPVLTKGNFRFITAKTKEVQLRGRNT